MLGTQWSKQGLWRWCWSRNLDPNNKHQGIENYQVKELQAEGIASTEDPRQRGQRKCNMVQEPWWSNMSVVDREKGHGPGDTEEEPQGDKEKTMLVWRMLINVIDLFFTRFPLGFSELKIQFSKKEVLEKSNWGYSYSDFFLPLITGICSHSLLIVGTNTSLGITWLLSETTPNLVFQLRSLLNNTLFYGRLITDGLLAAGSLWASPPYLHLPFPPLLSIISIKVTQYNNTSMRDAACLWSKGICNFGLRRAPKQISSDHARHAPPLKGRVWSWVSASCVAHDQQWPDHYVICHSQQQRERDVSYSCCCLCRSCQPYQVRELWKQ